MSSFSFLTTSSFSFFFLPRFTACRAENRAGKVEETAKPKKAAPRKNDFPFLFFCCVRDFWWNFLFYPYPICSFPLLMLPSLLRRWAGAGCFSPSSNGMMGMFQALLRRCRLFFFKTVFDFFFTIGSLGFFFAWCAHPSSPLQPLRDPIMPFLSCRLPRRSRSVSIRVWFSPFWFPLNIFRAAFSSKEFTIPSFFTSLVPLSGCSGEAAPQRPDGRDNLPFLPVISFERRFSSPFLLTGVAYRLDTCGRVRRGDLAKVAVSSLPKFSRVSPPVSRCRVNGRQQSWLTSRHLLNLSLGKSAFSGDSLASNGQFVHLSFFLWRGAARLLDKELPSAVVSGPG